MGLDDDIAEATRLARRESEVHEATELLLPLAKRFRDVLVTLRHAAESESEGVARETRERAEKILEQAVRTLAYVVGRQKTLPLASRVLEAESLARAVAELHGEKNEKGEVVGGLDGVLVALGERVDENKWRRRLEQEKREHVDLLRESISDVREELGADESMARETIVLLKHARAYGRWNALADELWAMVEPFAAPMENQDHLLELPAWFIPESDIVFRSRMLDRGGFATIHNAVWDGCSVVVKVLQDINIHQTKQLKQLVTEVEIGYGLSHPHVIKMYGACHTRSPPLIVCELAKYGNMSDYLHRYGEKAPKWRLLYEAALGLQFFHKNKIVHGDMKLNNILITADGKAKVGDFGLSRRRESPTASYLYKDGGGSDGGGAIRWRAPECFRTKPTFASDVYSFGMCIYEAVVGSIPYDEVSSNDVVKRMICDGKLPRRPGSVDDEVWELIERITRSDPESRSSLRSVVGALKELSSREDVGSSGAFVATIDGASVMKSTVLSGCSVGSVEANEVVVTETFGSVTEAVEALRQTEDLDRQLRALKWAFRKSISEDTYTQLFANGGVPVLKRIVENTEAPFVSTLYAFDILDSINNSVLSRSMTSLMSQIKATLHRPDEVELSAMYDQMADEMSREARLQAIEVFLICCEQDLIDAEKNVNHIVLELLRLFKVDDAQVNAAAAYAVNRMAHRHKMSKNALLRESVRPLASTFESNKNRSKPFASAKRGQDAADSPENRVAIARAGAIVPLIEVVMTASDACKEPAAYALGQVAADSPENRVAIARAGGIAPLTELLKTGPDTCKELAARALGNIAVDSPENRVAIARAGAIVPLIELVKTGSEGGRMEAARMLSVLSLECLFRSISLMPLRWLCLSTSVMTSVLEFTRRRYWRTLVMEASEGYISVSIGWDDLKLFVWCLLGTRSRCTRARAME